MVMFALDRREDETGISGTGIVAEGVIFSDGRCAMRWFGVLTSIAVYDSIKDVEAIHGHNGKTVIVTELDGVPYSHLARERPPHQQGGES